MGIYKRPDSRFWQLCLERSGQKPLREPTKIPIDGGTPDATKANKELAQKAYATRMGDFARGTYDLPQERAHITFAAYRRWYLEHVSVTKRGLSRERSLLNKLGEYFDDAPLASLDQGTIIEWRTRRSAEVAPGTVNRELGLLKSVLTTAVPKYLRSNPATGVRRLRIPEKDIRLLEPDEEHRLLDVCGPEDRAIVLCALDSLQRLSNVAGLLRAQDHGSHITVLNSKVSEYKVPVSRRLRKALDALPDAGPFYFPSAQASTEDVRRVLMTRRFTILCERAGIVAGRKLGGLTFHSLRHTGASRMLARGVDIKTVQQIGGWKNLNILQRYLHPTDAQRVSAVEVIGREQDGNAKGKKRTTSVKRRPRKNPKESSKNRAGRPLRRAS